MTSACMTDVAGTTALIAAHLRFVDSSGTVVTLNPQPAPTADSGASPDKPVVPSVPMTEYTANLGPTLPLSPDAAYALEIKSDGDFVLGIGEQTVAESTATLGATNTAPVAYRVPIFTGSAPKLAAIVFPIAAGKVGHALQLRFSEPVRLGDLVPSAFGIELPSGNLLAGCVLSTATGQCVVASAAEVSDGVDFEFSGAPPSESDLAQSAIVIAGSVRGRGRTVAEGALVRGATVQSTLVGPGLRTQLTAADWFDCAGGGKCVRDIQ